MPIPEFDTRGLLPDGVYSASASEMHERCVADFPGSTRRPTVIASFIRYQEAVAALGVNATQWVDGSFVDRTRLDPDDVDVVNFCEQANLNSLSPAAQAQIEPLLDGDVKTKPQYDTHSFLIVRFPPGHPFESSFEANRKYWRDAWSKAQDYSGFTKKLAPWRGKKGFLQMKVGDAKLCPDISDAP